MSPEECARLLLRCGAVDIRPDPADWFTWASGTRAPIYCDNRLLMGYPAERRRVADALVASIRRHHPDAEVVAGTATAGIPHAAWVAERLELPMAYVRGAAKGHGLGKRVEGRPLAGERVVLIEDLISLGGSSGDAVAGLQEEGGKVVGVQAIVSYGIPRAAERLASLGVAWHALTTYAEIVACLELDADVEQTLLAWRESL